MARRTEVKFNRGWGNQILNGSDMGRAVDSATAGVAARARASAPRDTGAYASSIKTGRVRRDRIVGIVVSDDPAALAIEARYGTLARALRAARRA